MPIASFAKRYAVAVAGSAYAFTAGLAARRHRALVHTVAKHFGYDDHPRRTLPCISADAITSQTTAVILAQADGVDGNVSLFELLCLARIVREREPKRIFEIGTFDGRTTLNFALNTPPDTSVHTLDLPPSMATRFELSADDRKYVEKPVSGARFKNSSVASRVTQLYGDSGSFDFSRHRADFIFVDGSHAYDYVISDSLNALQLLGGAHGTIVWHDYGEWPGVTTALNELRDRDPRFSGLVSIAQTSLAVLSV